MSIKVKLCGFTNNATIEAALLNKVDFVGFVFHKSSPRNISFSLAKTISKKIPKTVSKVAVCCNSSNYKINKIIESIAPDFLQLHGNETKSRVLEIKNQFNIKIIKSISIANHSSIAEAKEYENTVDYLLFDTANTNVFGGSGKTFDWKILQNLKIKCDWFLSGGLNYQNIEQAIQDTKAKFIDVSSGIESAKGIKSEILIKKFLQKIKSYEY